MWITAEILEDNADQWQHHKQLHSGQLQYQVRDEMDGCGRLVVFCGAGLVVPLG